MAENSIAKLLLLLTATAAAAGNSRRFADGCTSGYQCQDGECIPSSWRCDGYPDCSNGEDEDNCPSTTSNTATTTSNTATTTTATTSLCGAYSFECWNGICIPGPWECDGYEDCPNGEDERNCGSTTTTPDTTITSTTTTSTTTSSTSASTPTPTETTTRPTGVCSLPYDRVGDKCIVVELFNEGTHDEMQYECSRLGGSMLEFGDANDFWTILRYLEQQGLTQHDYWVGAELEAGSTTAHWLNAGTPVPSGTPLWAINRNSSSLAYEQEPAVSGSLRRVYMRAHRKLLLAAAPPDQLMMGTICEAPLS